MDSERIVPNDKRFNTHFSERDQEMILKIVEIQDEYSDVLNPLIEFPDLNTPIMIGSLAKALNEDILRLNDSAAWEAMYRAMAFSYQVATMIHGEPAQYDARVYLVALVNKPKNGLDQLNDDVFGYLGDNPHVYSFIARYAEELDGDRDQRYLVEMSAGLMFMLTERCLGEQHIRGAMKNSSMEDFES
jgi:hypothetical protein